ncbi:hypothetical protein [Methylotuvimicrobium sp. KM2]|uniref:hypothetical protein n=1 Tax=Methylotuvimicrobium sp. KM2 TaxID=3133976 RepID=UPI00310135BD
MMFDKRIIWISTITRTIGIPILMLVAMSLFDTVLLSKDSCPKIRASRSAEMKSVLSEIAPISGESGTPGHPHYLKLVLPQCPDFMIYRKTESVLVAGALCHRDNLIERGRTSDEVLDPISKTKPFIFRSGALTWPSREII